MASAASFLLVAGFAACLFGAATLVFAALEGREAGFRQGKLLVTLTAVAVTAASAFLLYFLATSDFRVAYVAAHTSRSIPMAYKLSAFWAGQEGSFLLWALVLAWYCVYVAQVTWARAPALSARALAIMMGVNAFFLFLTSFVANPFRLSSPVPADGVGLNPLLQNVGMLAHPVTLYLGYVGFTVPFAFALAFMSGGRGRASTPRPAGRREATATPEWLRLTRSFAVWSWLFLSVGIILGMQWAYVELGWGGYWSWDPVENASLLPWLTATAFLHSALVQERKGTMAGWNVLLVIVTFFLTILGTFLTRTGAVSSVHSFSPSGLEKYFVPFMLAVALGSAWVLARNWACVRETKPLESVLSREAAVILADFLFAAFALVVLWGTLFPLVSRAFEGRDVSVAASFYLRAAVPIGALTVALLGICQALGWSRTPGRPLARSLGLAAALAAAVALGVARLVQPDRFSFGAYAGFGTALLVTLSSLFELWRDTRSRRSSTGEGTLRAVAGLLEKNPRRYGALLVHLAIACMVVGFSGTAFRQESVLTLKPDESAQVAGYHLTFRGLDAEHLPYRVSVVARLEVDKGGRTALLNPQKQYYQNYESPFSEVSVLGGLGGDLYTILEAWDMDGSASLRVIREPLIAWIWIGGYLLAAGTLVLAWPRSTARKGAAGGGGRAARRQNA